MTFISTLVIRFWPVAYVYEDLISFCPTDVKEKQKENEWTLGKILCIENREFLEIDQIIAEHIEPMTRRIAEIIDHTKFQKKSKDDMCKFFELPNLFST
jgi:hypothetical protein